MLRLAPTLTSKLLQKLAMSSAEVTSATVRLQNDSNASFSDLWNSELLLKLSVTYCARQTSTICQVKPSNSLGNLGVRTK